MIKYPAKLTKNKKIGVTATSMGMKEENFTIRIDNAYKNLEKLGYKCIETNNVRTNKKLVSSDGKTRAKEFMELWQDENIGVIAQVHGGEFLIEMLPYLDKNILEKNPPKWTTGYSDSSLLNFYLTTNFNIATATTANIIAFGMETLDSSLTNQLKILEKPLVSEQNNFDLYEAYYFDRSVEFKIFPSYNLTHKVEYKSLYEDKAITIEGRVIGGNLESIPQLLGTQYDNTKNFCSNFEEGMLWYLEYCELTLPYLYRTLYQMKQGGWFNNAKGFLIGRTRSKESVEDFGYLDVLHKIFDDLNVPVIYDVDIGHVAPQWTMINGSYAKFEYDSGKGKITQYAK